MATLRLNEITKQWGQTTGVKSVNLEVADGEFIVILGPSGCGKTTTMRMVAGLEDPTQGDIFIGEARVNDLEPKDRDIAMVFQNYGLYPHLSVYENIRFPLKVRKVPAEDHPARVHRAAKMVELDALLKRKPRELSGGQRQRVALARAIVREPKIFLMDEPLSNLDAKLRLSMRAHLKSLQHQLGVTTIYVTHDQAEAMTLADRIVIMKDGMTQQIGTPEEIYNHPANPFVASFIGSPPMNLINGEVQDDLFIAPGVRINIPPASAELGTRDIHGKVTLGFRAEDAHLANETESTAGSADITESPAPTSQSDKNDQAGISGEVYSLEFLGDCTMINLKVGEVIISVKVGKTFRASMGETVNIRVAEKHCHFFVQ